MQAKTPVTGAVERGGRVIARGAKNFTGTGVPRFVKDPLALAGSLLITGVFKPRRAVRPLIYCAVIHHSAGEASLAGRVKAPTGSFISLRRTP